MAFQSINPATGEILETFDEWPVEKNQVIAEVHEAWLKWRQTSFTQRGELMKNLALVMRQNKEEYARLMAMEMGKPITEGRGEVEKCAWVCD